MGLMNFSMAVCAPAFPELGRTTVGGYQLLHGVPVRGADMAGPDVPPQHAFIPDLLDDGSGMKTVHVDLKTVHDGSAAISRVITGIKTPQRATLVVDMADSKCWNGLLDSVLEGSEKLEERQSPAAGTVATLLCGSGGMADALAERLALTRKLRASSSRKPRAPAPSPQQKDGPVLVFACSLHDATVRQVEEISGRQATTICPFDPLLIVEERRRREEVHRLTTSVEEAMENGHAAVVTPKWPDRPQLRGWLKGVSLKADGPDPAAVVIEHLGEVARRLVGGVEPGGLVLTGGETAASVFHELKSDGAWILDEIDTGVGLAAVAGGPHDGMGVVIKPGSFGGKHTLAKSMDRLLSRSRDTRDGVNRAQGKGNRRSRE